MKEIKINKNDAGRRLDSFLQKFIYNMPMPLIYKYIRKKRIKINGKRAKEFQRLYEGDLIELYINDEFFEDSSYKWEFKGSSFNLDVIYEDDNIIIVNKPAGLIVHPDKECKSECLINRIKNYLYKKGEYNPEKENCFSPSLVNRIDRNTSGLVIAAKNANSLAVLNSKMKNREINKSYLCIVSGKMQKKRDTLKGYLYKNESENKVYISEKRKSEDYKTILTSYEVIDEAEDFSLLKVRLLTGRTHQIRAHLASIGHFILGDGKYGKNSVNRSFGYKYQALCSFKIEFNFSGESSELDYLNGREIVLPNEKIWFIKDFYDNLKAEKPRKHNHKAYINY